MSKLTQAQVIQALEAGGFSNDAAATMAAIGQAESGLDPNALGDQGLETAKWGPSVGVFQIRTLKADTGTGSDRDLARLQGNLVAQVAAALHISNGGRSFSPWSTYTDGAYTKYLPDGTNADNASLLDKVKGLPGSIAGGALDAITAPLVEGFKGIAYVGAFAALGIGLVGLGVYRTFGTQIRAGVGTALKAAAL